MESLSSTKNLSPLSVTNAISKFSGLSSKTVNNMSLPSVTSNAPEASKAAAPSAFDTVIPMNAGTSAEG
ncbi:MAG: hypothetical protein FWD58_04825 [Firmicutes bacterium]|nr:hypothetical protein [Bacillota bacterium]